MSLSRLGFLVGLGVLSWLRVALFGIVLFSSFSSGRGLGVLGGGAGLDGFIFGLLAAHHRHQKCLGLTVSERQGQLGDQTRDDPRGD